MADSGAVKDPISPKVTGATVAAAVSTLFWTIAGETFFKETFSQTALTALTGATATILAFIFGYIIKDPLREDGLEARRLRLR